MGKQATFKTSPASLSARLEKILRQCGNGRIRLPDFQRSRVRDEERIKGLIASVSQAFPVGVSMTFEVKPGAADRFARRPIRGAGAAVGVDAPDQFLPDDRQHMTSVCQTCLRGEVVHTVTPPETRLLAMTSKAAGHVIAGTACVPEEGRDVLRDDEGLDVPGPDTEEAA